MLANTSGVILLLSHQRLKTRPHQVEESNIDADSNDSRFMRSEKLADEKECTQTPLIDLILSGMRSGVDAAATNPSELKLREVRKQFDDAPIDCEICTRIISRLLHGRLSNRLSPNELQSVAKSVADAMMAHPTTRSRIEKLWESLSDTQK